MDRSISLDSQVPPPPPPPPPLSHVTPESDSTRIFSTVPIRHMGVADIEQAARMRQKEMQFKIVGAIERQDMGHLTSLIDCGVNVDATILYTKTPLTYALELGHSDIACCLIRAGCDVEKPTTTTVALKPIHFAVLRNCPDALLALLMHGANVNAVDFGKSSSLHYACYFGFENIIDILLDNHADVTSADDCGRTPLHRSTERGHLSIAEKLIKYGASVNCQDIYGWPPLFQPIIFNNINTVKFLIRQNCDLDLRDRHCNTVLHIACDRCSPKSTQIILSTSLEYQRRKKKIPTEEITNLIGSNPSPDRKMVQLLVNSGANINARNASLETPLYLSPLSQDFILPEYLYLAGGQVDSQWLHLHDNLPTGSDAFLVYRHRFKPLFDKQMYLSHLCRCCIRRCLGHTRDIHGSVLQLPLPTKLKYYINACDQVMDS